MSVILTMFSFTLSPPLTSAPVSSAPRASTTIRKVDHRTRVAAERRERMRARLLESALAVFAEKGVGASVIQDVIAAAGVSQGTFYNYFRTNDDLLHAVANDLSNELIESIERQVVAYADPARRIAAGVRLYLHRGRAFPLLARFVVRTGVHIANPHNLVYRYLPPHLEAGFASGRFERIPLEVALDLITGQALLALARMLTDGAARDYPERVVVALLRALGVARAEAEKIAFAPLEELPVQADSLLARATERVEGAGR